MLHWKEITARECGENGVLDEFMKVLDENYEEKSPAAP